MTKNEARAARRACLDEATAFNLKCKLKVGSSPDFEISMGNAELMIALANVFDAIVREPPGE